ncbi:MAG: DNA polymerase III subunit alpha [Bacteroidales bacterium]|nr:DNA polymerase III subunit alpha [Bacteroidales bacterium]MCF8455079.1 DNA polymerase III subunit alpha [Bacteroidales bacterium]
MYLNTRSYYSLRYGTLSIDQLVESAKKSGIPAMALTDINNTMGCLDFVKQCKEEGIKPIVGIDFHRKGRQLYTGLARNNAGFRELNEFLSYHNLNNRPLPDIPPAFSDAYMVYPLGSREGEELRDNEYIGVRPGELRKLLSTEFRHRQNKLLVWQPVTFSDDESIELHRNLRAIDTNVVLSKVDDSQLADPAERILPIDRLLDMYRDFPQIIENTEKLLDDCSFEFNFKSIKNKQTFTGSRYDDKILLHKLAFDGLLYRYGKNDKVATKRVLHELEIIDRLGFSAYFLITWDVIRYSMSRGFYHVGRGSGANSVVAYCLKITDVDPIELDLYFERFLNPKRTSPPDFDIDYSWKERDDVIDYIFKRYGRKHTALLGMTPTFKGSSIIRELGKVHGLPKEEMDRMVDYPEDPLNDNEISHTIVRLGRRMSGFPNIRSIHAGGILISEEPITCYTSLDMPPKGFPTTQWDMYVAEDIGFEKLDILSQRGIGHIKDAAEIVRENCGLSIDVHQVKLFKEDKRVKEQLRKAETNGCFYIESPAMRGLLQKLKCDNYLSLVAASSIIRPGVAKSGMMRAYIQRFHKPDSFEYIHPVMKEQLQETYGVMVYQEDVLKICHHFAGLDLADADVLRRAMSGKHRSKKEFDRIQNKFFSNCKSYGYSDAITNEVWRQIESFAGYSFSKAHSASYAVESFQSLYLKAYYPREFMVAVINNFGGFYRTWVYFNEAKRWGATINLPCVNHSHYLTRIIDRDIYVGFIHLQNLESKVGKAIEEEQKRNGPFLSMEDFLSRIDTGLEQMTILIRIGAFRFTGKSKAVLLWEVHTMMNKKEKAISPNMLFVPPVRQFKLPVLEHTPVEDAFDEIELLEFPVSMSQFDLLQTPFRGEIKACELSAHIGKKVRMVGQLVTIKYVRTIKKELMYFGTFIDDTGEFFDSVHFPDSLKYYPFKGYGVYLLLGTVTEEFGFPSLTAEKLAKLPIVKDPRYV